MESKKIKKENKKPHSDAISTLPLYLVASQGSQKQKLLGILRTLDVGKFMMQNFISFYALSDCEWSGSR